MFAVNIHRERTSQILVDSGSTLDLVSGKMARRLQSLGHKMSKIKNNVKIKVANGRRSTLNQAITLATYFA